MFKASHLSAAVQPAGWNSETGHLQDPGGGGFGDGVVVVVVVLLLVLVVEWWWW